MRKGLTLTDRGGTPALVVNDKDVEERRGEHE